MKGLLAVACALNLLGAVLALSVSFELAAACVGAALFCAFGYAVLGRLDNLAEIRTNGDAIRKLLVDIRDQGAKRETPPASPPGAEFDAAHVVERMEAARRR